MNFVRSITWMLPCGNCGWNGEVYLRRIYLSKWNGNMKRKLRFITKNQYNFIKFFADYHNAVNKNTKKNCQYKIWTVEDIKEYYRYGYRWINPNIQNFENFSLNRDKAGCCVKYTQVKGKKGCKYFLKKNRGIRQPELRDKFSCLTKQGVNTNKVFIVP